MIKTVIIVAGGSGKRMQSAKLILVLPQESMSTWNTLCNMMNFNTPITIAVGGATRFHSVKSALSFVGSNELVAVHDAVRPLVSVETIARVFAAAESSGAAIPVIPPAESLRRVTQNENVPVNRNEYVLVQTPQVFHSNILLKAYQQEYNPAFTDDASVVQKAGFPVTLVEGNPDNIKITSPADLRIAEFLLHDGKDA
jgi:2-C-methyl-D-erythritol 4-phosphate cytidylyltransferase